MDSIGGTLYALDFRRGRIVVSGRWTDLRPLTRIEGVSYDSPVDGTGVVQLPRTRFNFMAVEAIQRPTAATEEYQTERASALAPSEDELREATRELRRHRVLEPAQFLPHQIEFIAFGRPLAAVFNGSEQGTGKTRMALGLCETDQNRGRKYLIICPKPVMREWSREWSNLGMDALYPETEIVLLDTGSSRQKALTLQQHLLNIHRTYFVVNYESVIGMREELMNWRWDKLVIDESWRIKSHKARVTEAITEISQTSRSVLLLSGTPIGNTAADLFTQCQVMQVPELPDTYKRFSQRFCDTDEIQINGRPVRVRTGIANVSQLMSFLDPVWYRATKESVLQLPPKVNETVYLPLDDESERIYNAFRMRDRTAIEEMLGSTTLVGIATRAQQVTGGFLVTRDDLRELPSVKIDWVRSFVHSMAPGSRVIVWCKYNAEVHRVARVIAETIGADHVAKVYGDTTLDDLESIKLGFNSKQLDSVWVIVAQVKKMCAGHNLQACDFNVFYSNSWSYIERSQAEDRSHRFGREGGIVNYDLICRNTIDEEIRAALDSKQDMMQRLAVTTSWSRLFGVEQLPPGDYIGMIDDIRLDPESGRMTVHGVFNSDHRGQSRLRDIRLEDLRLRDIDLNDA